MYEDEDIDRRLFRAFKSAGIPTTRIVEDGLARVHKSLTKANMAYNNYVAKAKAEIGEVRQWSDGAHKKVAEGEWVKVKENGQEDDPVEFDIVKPDKPKTELTDKQKAYLESNTDKLKFFNIKGLESHEHTKAILDAVKADNPDLEISDANKKAVVAKMKEKIGEIIARAQEDMARDATTTPKQKVEEVKADMPSKTAKVKDTKSRVDALVEFKDKTDSLQGAYNTKLDKLKDELKDDPTNKAVLKDLADLEAYTKLRNDANIVMQYSEDIKSYLKDADVPTDPVYSQMINAADVDERLTNYIRYDEKLNSAEYTAMLYDSVRNLELMAKYADLVPLPKGSPHTPWEAVVPNDLKQTDKNLGGSTGATLWHSEYQDSDYVVKQGASEGQAESEQLTNMLYQTAGILVPKSNFTTLYDPSGATPALVSQYITQDKKAVPLSSLEKGSYEYDVAKITLQQGFIYDALFGNWDVIGLNKDNVVISGGNGTPYRIDNGGSLTYRAQGGKKDFPGGLPIELQTMRDKTKNPSAHEFFGDITDDQLEKSILDRTAMIRGVIEYARTTSNKMAGNIINSLESRGEAMIKWARDRYIKRELKNKVPPSKPLGITKPKSDVAKHMETLKNWTKENLLSSKKIASLVEYTEKTTGVRLSELPKEEILSHITNTWNRSSIGGDFVPKREPGRMPTLQKKDAEKILAKSYAKYSNVGGVLAAFPGANTVHPNFRYEDKDSLSKYEKDFDDYVSSIRNSPDTPKFGGSDYIISSVGAYTGGGYNDMNHTLRDMAKSTSEYTADYVTLVDAFLANAPKVETTSYRGTSLKDNMIFGLVDAYDTGKAVELRGFTSSSTGKDTAFTGSWKFTIKGKTGVLVEKLGILGEHEVLYNTHTRFKINKYENQNQKLHFFEIEEI